MWRKLTPYFLVLILVVAILSAFNWKSDGIFFRKIKAVFSSDSGKRCLNCGMVFDVLDVPAHVTYFNFPVAAGDSTVWRRGACSPLCEYCWQRLSAKERVAHYEKMRYLWMEMFVRDFEIGKTVLRTYIDVEILSNALTIAVYEEMK